MPEEQRIVPSKKLDLDTALVHLARRDRKFKALIRIHGAPGFARTSNPFRSLARAIIYQQLSGKAADTICSRFEALYPGSRFPTPEAVLATDPTRLRSVGLSRQKASYLRDLAEKYRDGEIRHRTFARLSDEAIAAELTRVKGIGQWSADMFLIFALNRPDVLPVGDLGVRKGMQLHFGLKRLPVAEEMQGLAARWAPYRSVASWYMWRLTEADA